MLINGKGGVHHIWGCDHFKTTLNATEFKRAYKRRTDLVKAALDSVPARDRVAQVNAVMDAVRQGGLFVVDVDIVPTQIGSCAHVMLPAATSDEANLTSMNGERRMRLTERYLDPSGSALPDSLIVAKIARALSAVGAPQASRTWPTASRATTGRPRKTRSWTATIQMHPDDVAELKLKPGDLVEVSNDSGSTQATVWPTSNRPAEGDVHAVRLPDRGRGQRCHRFHEIDRMKGDGCGMTA